MSDVYCLVETEPSLAQSKKGIAPNSVTVLIASLESVDGRGWFAGLCTHEDDFHPTRRGARSRPRSSKPLGAARLWHSNRPITSYRPQLCRYTLLSCYSHMSSGGALTYPSRTFIDNRCYLEIQRSGSCKFQALYK